MSTTLKSTIAPHFWRTPFRYCRWAAHEKPAIYYSILLGITGPLLLVAGPVVKKSYGWEKRPDVPYTYPVPTAPRKALEGYEDP